jgi:hypothetical protein
MKARQPRARARALPPPKRTRRQDPESRIEKRIAAGEEPEAFLCIDCFCWSLEPVFCGCWARAIFPD